MVWFTICKNHVNRSLWHCVKTVRIRSYSGPHFPTFGLNMERYGVSLCIQSKCGKIRTRTTPNTDTFYVVWCCSYPIHYALQSAKYAVKISCPSCNSSYALSHIICIIILSPVAIAKWFTCLLTTVKHCLHVF